MRPGTAVVAGSFAASGIAHLVAPRIFYPLVPDALGHRGAVVFGSGAAELVCAAGLVTRQHWAPRTSAALLVVVWVGNLTMAVDVQSSRRSPWWKAAAWARLPLQIPLIRWAWEA